MATNSLEFRIDTADIEELERRYGSGLTARALSVTRTYTQKVQREARSMIKESGHVDTGQLGQRIQPEVTSRDGGAHGEVNAASEYARFIHEGAKHKSDTEIVPHFVPFRVAPSLLLWAKRNGLIYQKTKTGERREKSRIFNLGKWYMKGKDGKEWRISIRKGGLMVRQEAVKFFEVPFEKLSPQYFEKIRELLP